MATVFLTPSTTPSNYFRIASDTLKLPTDTSKPIPVGLIACQRDPLLRELPTVVISCKVSAPAPSTSKKKKGPVVSADSLLELVLHDTILFPEGGGQPSDTGLITSSDGTLWEVLEVKRQGGIAVHYLKAQDTEAGILAFPAGVKVGVSLGDAGFARRYDHSTMHTSQHVLSALLESRLSLPTLSWSLTAHPTPCYVELPRALTPAEIDCIQSEANKLAFEGRKVHIEVTELDRTQETGVEKTQSGREIGRGLPQDYTGGIKRVVVIDGVDRGPCCGTHLPTLHNLQIFLIPPADLAAKSGSSSVKLQFLCGPRLIAYLGSAQVTLSSTAVSLSCGIPLVQERVSQVVEERKRGEKRVSDLESELAGFIARDLWSQCGRTEGLSWRKHVHRTDDSPSPLVFLTAISTAFQSAATTPREYLIVLSSAPSAPGVTNVNVVLVFGSDEGQVKAVGDGLKVHGIKGGGKGKWSGKSVGVWKGKNDTAVEEVMKI